MTEQPFNQPPDSNHQDASERSASPTLDATNLVNKPKTHWRTFFWWINLIFQPLLATSFLVALIVGLGLAQKWGYLERASEKVEGTSEAAEDVLYICPMVCVPPSTEPGKCPVCGMDLKAQKQSGDSKDKYGLKVDPASVRLANIRTVQAQAKPLEIKIEAIGKISYNESSLASISAYVGGRIDQLYADFTGVQVNKGDSLALLYSPDLYSSQVALLEAKKLLTGNNNQRSRFVESNQRLYESSKQRLIELGLTEKQVQDIETAGKADSRISVISPITGTVIQKMATQGGYVKTGQVIYKVADLSTVWLMLEMFPKDAAAVRFGQKVETSVQSLPGKTFYGRVAFVDPTVNSKTQTVSVRVVVPNPGNQIRIGDFATATVNTTINTKQDNPAKIYDPLLAGKWISPRHPEVIADQPGKCPKCGIDLIPTSSIGFADEPIPQKHDVLVPRSAVLFAGGSSVAYVETETGRFEFRKITIGRIAGDVVSIVKGIQPGESVVASATLLIDSQFSMAGKPSLIDPNRAESKGPQEVDPFQAPEVLATLAKLQQNDRTEVDLQKFCPVTEMPLGSMGLPLPIDVEGKKVWICCAGCEKMFKEDPKKYFAILERGPKKKESKSSHDHDLPEIQSLDQSEDLSIDDLTDDLQWDSQRDIPDLEEEQGDDLLEMALPATDSQKSSSTKKNSSSATSQGERHKKENLQ